VYNPNGNGLRMIGSSKWEKCVACKGKWNMDGYCPDGLCYGQGGFNGGRLYDAIEMIDGSGDPIIEDLAILKIDEIKLVEACSIRSPALQESPKFPEHSEYPEWFDLNLYEVKRKLENGEKTKKFYNSKNGLTNYDEEGSLELGLCNRTYISGKDPRMKLIKKACKDNLPDIYKNVELLDAHHLEGANNDYYVVRTNSSFCMNVSREHNSNTIYFLINEFGIYQKCFCRCDKLDGRRFGYCKDYRSARYTLPVRMINSLFPNRDKTLDSPVNEFLYKTYRLQDLDPKLVNMKFAKLLQRKQMELQELHEEIIQGKKKHEENFNKPKKINIKR
jgi:hypothetical protein